MYQCITSSRHFLTSSKLEELFFSPFMEHHENKVVIVKVNKARSFFSFSLSIHFPLLIYGHQNEREAENKKVELKGIRAI